MKVMSPALPLRYILSDCGSTSRTTFPSFGPGLLHLLPVGGAVGVFAVGIFGQDHDGPDFLVPHDGAQARPPGLLRPEESLRPVHGLGGIEVVAVDAAVGGVAGADAGRKKDDLLAVAALPDEPVGDRPLQIEDLVDQRARPRW